MTHFALRFINSLSLSFWIGSIFFFSLCVAPSIFKVLPRNLAGDLVADIFPKYYLVGYICGLLLLFCTLVLLLRGYESFSTSNYLKIGIVILMLGLSYYSGTILREQVSDVKTELRTLTEGTEDHLRVEKTFRGLHARSAIINIIVFIGGIAIVIINNYTYVLNETNRFGR